MDRTVLLPRTWIPSTPRTWGNRKTEDEWLSCLRQALAGQAPLRPSMYGLNFRFILCPESSKYYGQGWQHGPDLDNLVKLTLDGLTPYEGRGVGLIPDDPLVYEIQATKELTKDERETGLWLSIYAIDGTQ